jgi:hypothetical protein
MKRDYNNWTYQDFLSYMLIYAASSDLNISEEEREYIQKRVEKDEFKEILKCFNKHSDYERIEVVKTLGEKYSNDIGSKSELRKELIKLFYADDDYSILEKNFFLMIKKIMKLNEY